MVPQIPLYLLVFVKIEPTPDPTAIAGDSVFILKKVRNIFYYLWNSRMEQFTIGHWSSIRVRDRPIVNFVQLA